MLNITYIKKKKVRLLFSVKNEERATWPWHLFDIFGSLLDDTKSARERVNFDATYRYQTDGLS